MRSGAPVRLGWAYGIAIGEALAEQVAEAVDLSATATVLDLVSDRGPMCRLVGRRLRPPGRLIIAELGGRQPGGSVSESTEMKPAIAEPLRILPDSVPLDDASCDVVVSLLTLGFGDAKALLAEARRLVRSDGAVAIAVYDGGEPPVPETIVIDALREQGIDSGFLRCLVPAGVVDHARDIGFALTTIRDVARFDGPGHFWMAMVEQRLDSRELARSASTRTAVRARVEARLRPYMAADDTIRIPVTARLLRV